MGYDGIIIDKQESLKLRQLLEKSDKFVIVDSVSCPTINVDDDRIMVRLEEDEVIVYDMDTPKLEKFLKKNKIKY